MKPGNGNKLTAYALIIYMISALLFLTSIDLHIHTGADSDKHYTEHTSAVHISSITDEIASVGNSDEINVSLGGVIKAGQPGFSISITAIILLTTLITVCCHFQCFTRFRDTRPGLPQRPFHGTPGLRAPPVFNT